MTEALKAAFAKAGLTEDFIAEELKSLITDPEARAVDRLETLKYVSKLAGIETPRVSGRQTTRGFLTLGEDDTKLLEAEQVQEVTVG